MMSFSVWNRGSVPRIYLNGFSCLRQAKAWWEETRDGGTLLKVSGGSRNELAPAIRETLTRLGLPAKPTWAEAMALTASAPSPRLGRVGQEIPTYRPFTEAEGEAMTFDFKSYEWPADAPKARVLVDHREPAELISTLQEVQEFDVQVCSLPLGDIVIEDAGIIIERKTVIDLKQSVEDKRIFEQSERLSHLSDGLRVLILEGNIYGMNWTRLENLSGLLSYLTALQSLSVIPTVSLRHSVYLMKKLARHRLHGLGYQHQYRTEKPSGPRDCAAYVVAGFPGVQTELAQRLLSHFGTLRALLNADDKALRAVDGVGPKTAKAILSALDAQH